MTKFTGVELHYDDKDVPTTAEWISGISEWVHNMGIPDGFDVTQGAIADAAVTNPASSGSVIALLKGILTGVNASSPSNINTTALAASLVIKATPGKLWGITGYSTSSQFIQLHDATSLPAEAAVPKITIPVTANNPFSIDFGTKGRAFASGIVICNSSTGPTKTIGGSTIWVDAQYE